MMSPYAVPAPDSNGHLGLQAPAQGRVGGPELGQPGLREALVAQVMGHGHALQPPVHQLGGVVARVVAGGAMDADEVIVLAEKVK